MEISSAENKLIGGLEAGGTKFNCVIGYGNGDIIARHTIPTTNPTDTLAQVKDFFKKSEIHHGPLQGLGIAHFGPVDINKGSEHYGKILATTKAGWSDTDIVGYFSTFFDIPIAFQSDVNVAAVGEYHFGAAKSLENFVYITVGTGIGGGVYINGQLLNTLNHPEVGHMMVPQDRTKDSFEGCCSFHNNCLEGLASGPALKARWGEPAEKLGEDHPAWDLEAHYLAQLCVNLTHFYGPEKIIFGGGVMQQKHLFPLIRKKFLALMNDYRPTLNQSTIDHYIVPTPLAGDSATKGALIMGHKACSPETGEITTP